MPAEFSRPTVTVGIRAPFLCPVRLAALPVPHTVDPGGQLVTCWSGCGTTCLGGAAPGDIARLGCSRRVSQPRLTAHTVKPIGPMPRPRPDGAVCNDGVRRGRGGQACP